MRNKTLWQWKVPLDGEAARRWQDEHGIVEVYVNDVAAGMRVNVPAAGAGGGTTEAWRGEDAVERVASGLRILRQGLWHLDLVRPVLAVYTVEEGVDDEARTQLQRLTWDDEKHRGDFALRCAATADAAQELLCALMGDTVGELDDTARADKVGIPEVRAALVKRLCESERQDGPEDRAERNLVRALLAELDRAASAPPGDEKGKTPHLDEALDRWASAQEAIDERRR